MLVLLLDVCVEAFPCELAIVFPIPSSYRPTPQVSNASDKYSKNAFRIEVLISRGNYLTSIFHLRILFFFSNSEIKEIFYCQSGWCLHYPKIKAPFECCQFPIELRMWCEKCVSFLAYVP